MRNIILVMLLVFVSSCGDGSLSDITAGQQGGITPIDNRSATSLYGTYKITSYSVADNGTETKFSGDNITGELIINSSEIRYRLEYDDGRYTYYSYNISDSQPRSTYSDMINSLINSERGNGIKNNNEILLSKMEAKKVSDTPIKINAGYSTPYKDDRLTPVKVGNVWNLRGTYLITKVRRIVVGFGGGLTDIDMSKGKIGIISFTYDKGTICDSTTLYKVWSSELTTIFPYDKNVPNSCYGLMRGEYELEILIIEANEDSYRYTLTKMYDATGF